MISAYDNRAARGTGQLHLMLRLGDVRICYAYIRKNGCSCFKAALGYPAATRISEIACRHRRRWFQGHDAAIFVWRDPLDRLLSLYRNKILDRIGADDILCRYRAAMGREPSDFESFVRFAMLGVDPHCLPQTAHLRPMLYTHAIPLAGLHRAMAAIVGTDAAAAFRQPVNSSAAHPVEVSDRALALVHAHYAADYRMIGRLRQD